MCAIEYKSIENPTHFIVLKPWKREAFDRGQTVNRHHTKKSIRFTLISNHKTIMRSTVNVLVLTRTELMWLLNDNRLKIIAQHMWKCDYASCRTHYEIKVGISLWKLIEYRNNVSIRNARNVCVQSTLCALHSTCQPRQSVFSFKRIHSFQVLLRNRFCLVQATHKDASFIKMKLENSYFSTLRISVLFWWQRKTLSVCVLKFKSQWKYHSIKTKRTKFSVIKMCCALFSMSTTSGILWVNAFIVLVLLHVSFH